MKPIQYEIRIQWVSRISFLKNMKVEIKMTEYSVIFIFKQDFMKNPNKCALGHCQGVIHGMK